MRPLRVAMLSGLLTCLSTGGLLALGDAAVDDDVYRQLSLYVMKQIRIDKQVFLEAQLCTEWFYRRQRPSASPPKPQAIAWIIPESIGQSPSDPSDCASRYPGGLSAAREDFSQAQSVLTITLTFYEYVLVGDRDDDNHYSEHELQDVLESFDLRYNAALPPTAHLQLLQTTFDSIRGKKDLEQLMGSMGRLYSRGYRLTTADRDALSKVMG